MIRFPEIKLDEHGKAIGEGDIIEILPHQWMAMGTQLWKGIELVTDFCVMSPQTQVLTRHLYLVDEDDCQERSFIVVGQHPFAIVEDPSQYIEPYKWFDISIKLDGEGGWDTAKWKEAEKWRVPHPKFVRGAFGWRWVSLSSLASFLSLTPESLWNFYRLLKSGGDWEDDSITSSISNRLTIALYDPTKEGNRRLQGLSLPPLSCADIWVPAGWAMDICRLSAAGYRPTT